MQYGIIHKGAIIHVRPASTYDYNTAIDGISISQLRKFDDLIKAGNKEFSKSDYAEIVSKTNGYYFNNPELADKVSVFAYEGAGTVADKPWLTYKDADKSSVFNYHPYGQFNAMMLGIENDEIIAFTMNGSTLPDDPRTYRQQDVGIKKAGDAHSGNIADYNAVVVKDGIYFLDDVNHKKYAAAKLYDYHKHNKGVPIYNYQRYNASVLEGTTTGVNFHTAGATNNTYSWSLGCITIVNTEYVDFGNKIGLFTKLDSYKSSLGYDYHTASYNTIKNTFFYSTYGNQSFSGSIVIDRSIMRNKLTKDGRTDLFEYYGY